MTRTLPCAVTHLQCLYNTEAAAPNCAPYIFAPKLDQLKLKPLACGKAHAKVWNGELFVPGRL